MRIINYIVLCCTQTPEAVEVDISDLRREARLDGKTDIGEHFVIHRDGSVVDGRPLEYPANVLHHINKDSIFIKLVGARGNFTEAQEDAVEELIDSLIDIIDPTPSVKDLHYWDMWVNSTGLR